MLLWRFGVAVAALHLCHTPPSFALRPDVDGVPPGQNSPDATTSDTGQKGATSDDTGDAVKVEGENGETGVKPEKEDSKGAEDTDEDILQDRKDECRKLLKSHNKAEEEEAKQIEIESLRTWVDEKSLMSFWLMPISFAFKIGFTMAVFGAGIRTKKEEFGVTDGIMCLVSQLAGILFLVMALNSN